MRIADTERKKVIERFGLSPSPAPGKRGAFYKKGQRFHLQEERGEAPPPVRSLLLSFYSVPGAPACGSPPRLSREQRRLI